jgi:ADP-ribosylglycohydrolase
MSKLNEINYAGCIVGGAIGDALGAPIEFKDLKTILKKYGPYGVNDYVEFSDGRGEITDDTQMLLFTAEGLLRSWHRATNRGIWGAYTTICYNSYQRWLKTQNPDNDGSAIYHNDGWLLRESFLYKRRAPGNTCLSALESGQAGVVGDPINKSKGSGGVMRIAPVGLLFHKSAPETVFQIGVELAAMTHGHPSGYLPAGFLATLLYFINNGQNLINSTSKAYDILKGYEGHEETTSAIQKAIYLYRQGNPSYQKVELLGAGWTGEEAISISLYCALCFPNDFERAINLSINHSGDSDSTGSITGNIVGLMVGENGIPERWIKNLSNYKTTKQVALDLHTEVKGNGQDFDEEWDRKYPGY